MDLIIIFKMDNDWKTIDASTLWTRMTYEKPQSNKINSFDPCDMMIKRRNKQLESEESIEADIVNYDVNEIKELEAFCKTHNIIGFNCGKMSPKAALNILKNKLGALYNSENKKMLHG